ncbi:MAG: M23 family metallopeptidase [Pseudomonadota bacterium]|nr:M23 family metallopeptidase [Pseudomonadota bacterium]
MPVLRNRIRTLRHLAAIGVMAGAVAGCSSDFTRFNADLYADTQPPAANAANPYPDNVDGTVTSSVTGPGHLGAPQPLADVATAPDHGGYRPAMGTDQSTSMQWSQQNAAPGASDAYDPSYRPPSYAQPPGPGGQLGDVARADLSPAAAPATDSLVTSSVPASAQPATGAVRGWSATGGTTVTMRSGETLYNLSKRYGVPLNALMKANGISDPSRVQAGQSIVVPTYVYGRDVPVSAPDNDPRTRYASADRGALYAPAPEAVPVPEQRPRHYAARGGEPARADMSTRMVSAGPVVDPVVTSSPDSATAGSPRPYVKPGTDAGGTAPQRQVARAATPPARTGIEGFRWPVRGRVISNFGDKVTTGRNDGIDISVPEGTAVKAVENGVVVYSGSELEGFGNLILIRHDDGWVSAYAHNKTLEVARGSEVRRGEIIARSGRSGNAETPKLHFELRRNSVPLDPLKHLGDA